MYSEDFRQRLSGMLDDLHAAGLGKDERPLAGAQGVELTLADGSRVLNLCSNDYLGLAAHPDVVAAAHAGLDRAGFGMASVRFICGTHALHGELERRAAEFLGMPAALLLGSCFDANAALFEVLLGPEDVIIADRLIHASLIDGIRLGRSQQDSYKNAHLEHLRSKLEHWQGRAHTLVIITDGVFSMDGVLAPVGELAALAEHFGALLVVDDSHATGVIGPAGRGTPAHFGVAVDIITTTLGKALGGASGGIVAGPVEVIELLRNRARPYLFSNSVPPVVVAGSLRALELAAAAEDRRELLRDNATYLRGRLESAGFTLVPGTTPIVPVMLGDARLAADMARELLAAGVYVVGFSHPVVPLGKARIRVQLSAAHTRAQLDTAADAFERVGRQLGVLG